MLQFFSLIFDGLDAWCDRAWEIYKQLDLGKKYLGLYFLSSSKPHTP